MKKNFFKTEIAIFLLALALRSVVLYWIARNPGGAELRPDSTEYIRLARGLVDHGVFPVIKRAPLYPALLSFLYLLFGNGFVVATVALQAALDSLTAVVVSRIARAASKQASIAAAAGIIYALAPLCITSAGLLMTETLFNFFFALSILALVRCRESASIGHALAGGAMFGLAVLTRAAAQPLLLLAALWLIRWGQAGNLEYWKSALIRIRYPGTGKIPNSRPDPILALRNAAILFAAAAAIIVPWKIRNLEYYGEPVVTNIVPYNLYCIELPALAYIDEKGYTAQLLGKNLLNDHVGFAIGWWGKHESEFRCHWAEQTKNPMEGDRALVDRVGREARATLARRPGAVLAIHLIGAYQALRPSSNAFLIRQFRGKETLFTRASAAVFLLVDSATMLLFVIGLGAALAGRSFRGRLGIWILFILVAIYFPFGAGLQSSFRFRIPAQPLISAFSAAGALIIYRAAIRKPGHEK